MRPPFDGTEFHASIKRVYFGDYPRALNKRRDDLVTVKYVAPHENTAETGDRRGHGTDLATWLFSEEPGTAEHIFTVPFELAIDASLDAGAALGLHYHDTTEEFYYVLAGSITMTTIDTDGTESATELHEGDVHFVRLGQGHFGVAGSSGVRFLAVAARRQ
ncbi:MAG: cupin domain-containing protein [Thermoanaerobaculia bacterium]|nr:cupin domain-containing protein [Thermoanaerobaculia bacterium]